MSLLTLSPEATRLRRVAKAHAAGEISQREYRAARRQVINKFAAVVSRAPAYGAEDTVPRFDLENTLRRQEGFPEPAEVVQRQSWFMWLCLLLVVGVALWLPLMSQAAAISAVSERDPNPSTAQTFNVDQVEWIAPEDLQASLAQGAQELLATGLQQLKDENSPIAHGFSEAELAEVGRFLNAIGVHDETVSLSAGDLQDLKALVTAQKSKRGVSLPQLEQLAKQLQSWLRGQGYPLATAYIPAQDVVNDTVQVDVAFGLLSSISVADQASARLQTRFSDLLGKRVQTQAIETRLNTLNRQLGVQSEVYFQPGVEVGESEMVLQVKQHRQLGASIGLDNYGVEALGQERIVMQGRWNSPRGTGDVLSAKAFSTLENSAHRFLQVGYASPVLGGKFDAAAHLSYADLQLDSGSAFSGEGVLLDTQLTDTQVFTRTHRQEFVYSVGYHQFDWDEIVDQQTWFVAAALDGHRLWDNQKIALQGSVKALVGSLDDTRPGQDDSYWRLSGEMNAWMPLSLPFDWAAPLGRPKLVLDAQWQFSASELPPTLRLNAAGPHASKGFSQGQTLLDQGLFVSTAARFDAPVGQWWIFWDGVYGEQQGVSELWAHLSSAGLGWEGQWLRTSQGALSSRVTLAYPLSHKGSENIENDSTQIFWSLRYVY